ncbi:MAG: L-fuconate dehydratase [Gemmatimonadaceae bacterium]
MADRRPNLSRTITHVAVHDIRFPTSQHLDGSDAMNPDPDYSAAYVILRTDAADGIEGHGLTFTIGRGNELCVAAVQALAPLVVGQSLRTIAEDMGAFWRRVTGDSQLRWVGPEKGVIHLATAAMVNAVWDLWAKVEGKPLWQLLCDMTPAQLVRCIDFRYITDAITPAEAMALLERNAATRGERLAELQREGYPAYTTSAGWLGYSDDKIRALCREGVAQGWSHFKIKVGRDLADDIRRATIIRDVIGPDRKLMMDANQVWDVNQAIANMRELARFDPWWIEEPTSPDDVLGHAAIARAIAPIGVATGEHCQNRVLFKQLMQANAIRFCQIDSCRLGGVNEVLAVLLMAAKFGVPVCPHAGGVGLCEYVQHLAIVDYVCVSASLQDRIVEFVDHLHEHFVDPVRMRHGRYVVPSAAGYSITMKPESIVTYAYPTGSAWQEAV